jgi:hypothetical protein
MSVNLIFFVPQKPSPAPLVARGSHFSSARRGNPNLRQGAAAREGRKKLVLMELERRELMRHNMLVSRCLPLLAALLLASMAQAAPAPPDLGEKADLTKTRAVLEITSQEGVCYWSISGDDLIRMPVKDDRFESLLLSAKIENDQVSVALAGEREPLETLLLGRYAFSLGERAGQPLAIDEMKSTKTEPWQLRILRPGTGKALPGCCACTLLKLQCCPHSGKCLDCGTCGTCCG